MSALRPRTGAGRRRTTFRWRSSVPEVGAVAAVALGVFLLAGCRVVGAPPAGPADPDRGGEARPGGGADPGAEDGRGGPGRGPTRPGEVGGDAGGHVVRRPDPAPRPVPRPFQEVRALWVVRTTLTSPERIRAMVDRAAGAGFNTLVVQVRGRGDAYYRSAWEPRAEALAGQPPGFDPLATVLREAHARGLAVHAWVNTHLVAGVGPLPRDPDHVVNQDPDLLAVPRELAVRLQRQNPFGPGYVQALLEHARANPARVEGLYTAPSHPEVHERVVRVWLDLLRHYRVDGVHFDYVRYPGPEYDYSAGALRAFRAWAGHRVSAGRMTELDAASRRDPLAWTTGEARLWSDFRREQITGLVRRVHREAKALRPDLVVSAAVFPDAREAREHRFQEWDAWLREGIIDVAVPMAYTSDAARFRTQIADAVRIAGDPRRVWAGIGVYLTTFDGTVARIDTTRELGATGVVLFSYDWAVSEGESAAGVPFLDRVGRRAFGR